jgi:hypothetical protein
MPWTYAGYLFYPILIIDVSGGKDLATKIQLCRNLRFGLHFLTLSWNEGSIVRILQLENLSDVYHISSVEEICKATMFNGGTKFGNFTRKR